MRKSGNYYATAIRRPCIATGVSCVCVVSTHNSLQAYSTQVYVDTLLKYRHSTSSVAVVTL